MPRWLRNTRSIQSASVSFSILACLTLAPLAFAQNSGRCEARITVVDAEGQPISGVRVTAMRPSDYTRFNVSPTITTDVGGLAVFTKLIPSSEAYAFIARTDDRPPARTLLRIDKEGATGEANLIVPDPIEVRGIATCADGKPAAGWKVSAQPDWGVFLLLSGRSDIEEDGSFTLANLAPGDTSFMIHIDVGNGMSSGFVVQTISLPAAEEVIDLHIPRNSPGSMASIRGRVDPYVPGTELEIAAIRANRYVMSSRVDDDGSFEIGPLDPGVYTLRADSPVYDPATVANVTAPGEDVFIEVVHRGQPFVAGRVVDAQGQPITDYRIRARKTQTLRGSNYTQSDKWSYFNDPDGRFSLELVGPGVYEMQVAADGFAKAWSKAFNTDKDAGTEWLIELEEGVSLAGTVVDEDGNAISNAKVVPLSEASGTMPRVKDRFVSDLGAVKTDNNGAFTLSNLVPTRETLRVEHPDYCFTVVRDIDLSAEIDPANVVLTRGGSVEGHVYDGDGNALAETLLIFQDQSGYGGSMDEESGRLATAVTDANGYYRVDHLPDQMCYVRRDNPWSVTGVAMHAIVPKNGEVRPLDMGGQHVLTGRILRGGEPLAKAHVQVGGDHDHFGILRAYGYTDANGVFQFRGIPRGLYLLYYAYPEQRGQWGEVCPIESTGSALDLVDLELPTGEIAVTVNSSGGNDGIVPGVYLDSGFYRGRDAGRMIKPEGAEEPYRFAELPDGKYVVQCYRPDMPALYEYVTIDAAHRTVDVRIDVPESVGVLDAEVINSEYPYFSIRRVDRKVQATGMIEDGRVRIENLPPGEYVVGALAVDNVSAFPHIAINENETTNTNINLSDYTLPNTARLNVAVVDTNGVPLPGSDAWLIQNGKRIEPYQVVDHDHRFMPPAGAYELHVQYPGLESVTKAVALEPVNARSTYDMESVEIVELRS